MPIPTFDAARHGEMIDLLGPELTLGAVRDLRGEIVRAFADMPAAGLAESAHAVSSQAEILGFLALGAACRDMQRNLRVGTDVDGSLDRLRTCAREATAVVDRMLSP